MQKTHGGLTFDMMSLKPSETLLYLRNCEIDLAFCYSPEMLNVFSIENIHSGRLVICARRGHPASEQSPRERIRILNEYGAALPKSLPGIKDCATHPIFRKWRIDPKIVLRYDNYDVGDPYLKYSNCWSLVPHWIVRKYSGTLREVISDPSATVRLSGAWSSARPLPSPLKLLKDDVAKIL